MSFDLKINNGDLVIGSDGDLDQIQDASKLIQDILKILQTPLGSNVFFAWYGSLLTDVMIGQVLDKSVTTTVIQQQIKTNLETLQRLQRHQLSNGQHLTPGELLAAIREISVHRNTSDPTMYQIVVKVITKAFRTETASLDVEI
jgi:phage baseplate assembly protein W